MGEGIARLWGLLTRLYIREKSSFDRYLRVDQLGSTGGPTLMLRDPNDDWCGVGRAFDHLESKFGPHARETVDSRRPL
jgi:hypothetical protein